MITKYSQFRNKIQSGDLLAWTHTSWKSWEDIQVQVVRIFTQSEYSHVGVAWKTKGRLFVLDAVVPRVQICPLSLCDDFYHIDMGKTLSKAAEEFALSQVGEPYSKWQAVAAFFNHVHKGDRGTWQCAKYANEILRANGFDYDEAFTPSTLVQKVLEDGKALTFVQNDMKVKKK